MLLDSKPTTVEQNYWVKRKGHTDKAPIEKYQYSVKAAKRQSYGNKIRKVQQECIMFNYKENRS